jgi:phosphonopyruvate decarboxylase
MTLNPQRLFDALQNSGLRDFAGVPCSILDPLTTAAHSSGRYVAASVEGEALAIAAGAWLAGGQAGVLLQNSGLGNAVNPLASLLIPYRIPALLIVSWRGEPGRPDAVHHYPMGAATPSLLDIFGVPKWVLREDSDVEAIAAEAVTTLGRRQPAAIIVPRGVFGKGAKPDWQCSPSIQASTCADVCFGGGALPTRAQVVAKFMEHCGKFATVSTTGYASRELATYGPRDQHFYMQGSMGFALGIALGVAWQSRQDPIFVLDGDGALIMRLGSLVTAGALRRSNLVHVVLDNGAYASTGGQPTASAGVDFSAVARACGYRRTARCLGVGGLAEAMEWARYSVGEGPALLHVQMSPREAAAQERPEQSPDEIATAFRNWRSVASHEMVLPGHAAGQHDAVMA